MLPATSQKSKGNMGALEGFHATSYVKCSICEKIYKIQGIGSHRKKCKKEQRREKMFAERRAKRALANDTKLAQIPTEKGKHAQNPDLDVNTPANTTLSGPDAGPSGLPPTDVSSSTVPDTGPSTQRLPQVDDTKVEGHRTTDIPAYAVELDNPQQDPNMPNSAADSSPPNRPLPLFLTRADFEFAEFVHEAGLNEDQVMRLLDLIARITAQKDQFTLKTSGDVERVWEMAKKCYPIIPTLRVME
ncbi:hypothetical protein BDY19DRAFT_914582 [Irpex rosettiformis]|uniref:Uncharacterized protein n=1 Tax=Irpex rosettiformis TaxID=378272 RepID=A0ACB8UK67_9APHY|nr:hypothetical protein BDY19DRAFT_914582 [Irpex rosettiformis]